MNCRIGPISQKIDSARQRKEKKGRNRCTTIKSESGTKPKRGQIPEKKNYQGVFKKRHRLVLSTEMIVPLGVA